MMLNVSCISNDFYAFYLNRDPPPFFALIWTKIYENYGYPFLRSLG